MKEFKDIQVERSGKTHFLKEYEVGVSFGAKLKYIIDESPFEDARELIADAFFVGPKVVDKWISGATVPTNRNIITVVNKYFRFAYERNNGGEQ